MISMPYGLKWLVGEIHESTVEPYLFQGLVLIVLVEDQALVIWQILLEVAGKIASALSPGTIQACTSVGNYTSSTKSVELNN